MFVGCFQMIVYNHISMYIEIGYMWQVCIEFSASFPLTTDVSLPSNGI